MNTRYTLRCQPRFVIRCADLARNYLGETVAGIKHRPKKRDCIIYSGDGVSFYVWGDVKHVRVEQAP